MCIELDPTFSKGYTRKGAIQFFMKEYDKALETYQEGLKHDPQNQELLDGVRRYLFISFVLHSSASMVERVKLCSHFFYRCVGQLNKASRGDLSPEELKERQVSLFL